MFVQGKRIATLEEGLVKLVKTIEFRKVYSKFEMQLVEDLKRIIAFKKTITPADKTSNMCRCLKSI